MEDSEVATSWQLLDHPIAGYYTKTRCHGNMGAPFVRDPGSLLYTVDTYT